MPTGRTSGLTYAPRGDGALRIAINVCVEPGFYGGVAPALRSLISALGLLTDGPEEYDIVVGADDNTEWLCPLGANQRFVTRPKVRPRLLRRLVSPVVPRLRRLLEVDLRKWPEVPVSDGFLESLGCDVVHFPTQFAFMLCAVPSVYNPHDLQHLHYPQFFSPADLVLRETFYPAGCRYAKAVIVNSQWVKDDVVRHYNVSPSKVHVVPEASPTQLMPEASVEDAARVRERYDLSADFALYPATTWPHKNHLRLFEALAYLRDRRGLVVQLVCTGTRHERSWPQIEAKLSQLGLTDQVRFLGFVPDEDLRGLYRLATCLVLPTLFEANSLPVFEAWHAGLPVASSNVTALPEQIGEAGLLFDPLDPTAIGDALARLFTEAPLRAELRDKGHRRLADFDWTRTAKAYRAIYRQTAGQKLCDEDRSLLEWDWMKKPG
ncbi:MAG: glycosyltransferase family 4 protein [Bacteroidota bacterium]